MQGVADARLKTRGETLAIVVPECAEHGPVNAIGVHRASGVIQLFPESRVHAADHVVL